jgi:mono/diheme cytochrome c family protein
VLRALGTAGAVLAVAAFGIGVYVARTWDRVWDAPLPDLHASTDALVIARGEYFVYGPAHCAECHLASFDEFQKVARGEKPPLVGGSDFSAAPLGVIYSKNLTPDPETGIGRYSDRQIARMMRYAVRPNGHASVQPLMPFENMSDEDVIAIISYLRSRPAVNHQVPENNWTLIGKIVKSFAPVFKPRVTINPPASAPTQQPSQERGEYLARYVANCVGCHTSRNQLTFDVNGVEFAGGNEMEPIPFPEADPATWYIPPNLTPQKGSALDKFPDRDTFVARFLKGGRQHAGSPMPWESFARMAPEDIGALYEFFKSRTPAPGPVGDPRVFH